MSSSSSSLCISPIDVAVLARNNSNASVHIPGSKSHSIRALFLAALAEGSSTIYNLLDSGDVQSCKHFLQCFGISIAEGPESTADPPTVQSGNLASEQGNIQTGNLVNTQSGNHDHVQENLLAPITTVQSKGLIRVLREGVNYGSTDYYGAHNTNANNTTKNTANTQTQSATSPLTINLGNSGTTLYFATALLALGNIPITLDGDESLRTRSATPLLKVLRKLGATITEHGREGCVPYTIVGTNKLPSNIEIAIDCPTSQYLSALLLALSLTKTTSIIKPKLAGEFPYIAMTLDWLANYLQDRNGTPLCNITHDELYTYFKILPIQSQHTNTAISLNSSGTSTKPHQDTEPKQQTSTNTPTPSEYSFAPSIQPFTASIKGDFSSATFFLGLSAITGTTLQLYGMQEDNTQADMAVLDILFEMGCSYTWEHMADSPTKCLKIARAGDLLGGEFDLANIPDSLPLLAVVAAYARTPTLLYNVAHARKKETDRIAVMAQELATLGVQVEEREDGLYINSANSAAPKHLGFKGGEVDSHHDHRIAMSLAVGTTKAQSEVILHNAEVASITFPGFFSSLVKIGATITEC